MDEVTGRGVRRRGAQQVGRADLVHPSSLVEQALAGILTVVADAARGGGHAVPAVFPVAVVSGEDLEEVAPGPALVELLDGLNPAAVGADTLIEAIAAWERVMAWGAARQAELVRAFTVAEEAAGREAYTGDAIATRLGVTRARAEHLIGLGVILAELPELGRLLAAGQVDTYKAEIIANELQSLPLEEQREVLGSVSGQAADLTGPQLRARLRRAVLARDPAQVENRRLTAAAKRRVELSPAPDAMAWIGAYLPAQAAEACFTALTALAGNPAPGDERGIDARRADAFADVFHRILDSGQGPYGELPTQQRRRPHIQVTVAASTLLGLDHAPGELAGYGPIPADLARQIAADGTWRRLLTDPATGEVVARGDVTYRPGADLTGTVLARDVTCCFPGCRIPAWRCDLDHVVPFDPGRPAAEQTTAANLQALCRHHHRLKTETSWEVIRDAASSTTIWTSPWGREYTRHPYPAPGPDPTRGPDQAGQPGGPGADPPGDSDPPDDSDLPGDSDPPPF